MSVIRRVRIHDASKVKTLTGLNLVSSAEDLIRDNDILSDERFICLCFCKFNGTHSVNMHFAGSPDHDFIDSLITYLLFEKGFYKLSVTIPVTESQVEENLLRSGFVQEALLHEELYVNDSFMDAGLFYITLPMYKKYGVGFIPFQRGVISISGGVDYVDEISFLKFSAAPKNKILQRYADHSGFIDQGIMKPRGDECYKDYVETDLPAEVMRAIKQIREYLIKERESFDINVRLPATSEFREKVWECLKKIPYGCTRSYEDIALDLTGGDYKKALKLTRAVGRACSENPVPIIIPCHRVIGKDGKLVGFKDGVEFKDFLLTHELFAALPLA